MMTNAQKIAKIIEKEYNGDSLTIAIQVTYHLLYYIYNEYKKTMHDLPL
jgi:hypothetical protein